MDSAPAHMAKKTVQWLNDHQVKYISKAKWLASLPDLAPIVFAINGIFKRILKSRVATNSKQRVEETSVVHNSQSIAIVEETCDLDVRQAGLSNRTRSVIVG